MLTGNALRDLTRALVGAEARGSKRNRKRKKKPGENDATQQQRFDRCASQVPACEAEMRRACDNGPNCISLALPCCQALTTCDFTTFFTCADEVLSQL